MSQKVNIQVSLYKNRSESGSIIISAEEHADAKVIASLAYAQMHEISYPNTPICTLREEWIITHIIVLGYTENPIQKAELAA